MIKLHNYEDTEETCGFEIHNNRDDTVNINITRKWKCAVPKHDVHQLSQGLRIRKNELYTLVEMLQEAIKENEAVEKNASK